MVKITVFTVRSNKISRILIFIPGLPCVLFEDRGCTVLGLLSLMWAKAKQVFFNEVDPCQMKDPVVQRYDSAF